VATTTRSPLGRLLWLSVAAAIATITLKTLAWALTGSVGLLSPANAAVEVGPSVPEIARRAAARCACDVIAVTARRHPWSSGGLSRRQLKRLRHAEPREVIEFGR